MTDDNESQADSNALARKISEAIEAETGAEQTFLTVVFLSEQDVLLTGNADVHEAAPSILQLLGQAGAVTATTAVVPTTALAAAYAESHGAPEGSTQH